MPDVLIQTRVPSEVAEWVTHEAEGDADTVAGWLRRRLMREMNGARVRAWVQQKRMGPWLEQELPRFFLRDAPAHHYWLHPVHVISATERVFAMYSANGKPIPRSSLTDGSVQSFMYPSLHRYVLEGSMNPWAIVTVMFDDAAQRPEITLRALADG